MHQSYHYSSQGKENGKEKKDTNNEGRNRGFRPAIVNPFVVHFSHHKTHGGRYKSEKIVYYLYQWTIKIHWVYLLVFLMPDVSSSSSAEWPERQVSVLACGWWIGPTQRGDVGFGRRKGWLSNRKSCYTCVCVTLNHISPTCSVQNLWISRRDISSVSQCQQKVGRSTMSDLCGVINRKHTIL